MRKQGRDLRPLNPYFQLSCNEPRGTRAACLFLALLSFLFHRGGTLDGGPRATHASKIPILDPSGASSLSLSLLRDELFSFLLDFFPDVFHRVEASLDRSKSWILSTARGKWGSMNWCDRVRSFSGEIRKLRFV